MSVRYLIRLIYCTLVEMRRNREAPEGESVTWVMQLQSDLLSSVSVSASGFLWSSSCPKYEETTTGSHRHYKITSDEYRPVWKHTIYCVVKSNFKSEPYFFYIFCLAEDFFLSQAVCVSYIEISQLFKIRCTDQAHIYPQFVILPIMRTFPNIYWLIQFLYSFTQHLHTNMSQVKSK